MPEPGTGAAKSPPVPPAHPEGAISAERPAAPHPRIPTFEVADESEHRVLARWRRNVGSPVALDLAPPAPQRIRGLDVLCWNLKVGGARLDALLGRLREGEFGGAGTDPERPLVVLAQEAYRADESVPERVVESGAEGGDLTPPDAEDVVAVARRQGLSLRYAPSMRNGAARSDRGNAVLCTTAIGHAHGFALLYLRQRRVAVAAEVHGVPGLTLVSAHLDTHRRPFAGDSDSYVPGGARAEQARRLAEAVVRRDGPGGVILGGDFNTPLGHFDPAYRALVRAGLTPARRARRWLHTHHGPVRFLLDHLLYHSASGHLESVVVTRLDEHPADRGDAIFGSDHHPLLARVALRGA